MSPLFLEVSRARELGRADQARTTDSGRARCGETPSGTAQRILKAAAEVFNERGLEVSLDEIARYAGVGVGTVYRRFRTKEELVEALFVDRIDSIAAIAEQALRHPTPGRAWCRSWSRWPR